MQLSRQVYWKTRGMQNHISCYASSKPNTVIPYTNKSYTFIILHALTASESGLCFIGLMISSSSGGAGRHLPLPPIFFWGEKKKNYNHIRRLYLHVCMLLLNFFISVILAVLKKLLEGWLCSSRFLWQERKDFSMTTMCISLFKIFKVNLKSSKLSEHFNKQHKGASAGHYLDTLKAMRP